MQYLARRIGDKLEEDNQDLKGLGNLTAVNLKKSTHKYLLPADGSASDFLKEGDHLVCELESYEIWLKANINYSCTQISRP